MDRTALLQKLPLFAELKSEDLAQLAQKLQVRRKRKDESVFEKGDLGTTMFVVSSGRVDIVLPSTEAEPVLLKEIGPGEYFGELSLFDDKPRSASARCSTQVELLELDRATLTEYLSGRPHAALAILHTMSERLRETNALLSNSVSRNAFEEAEGKLRWQDKLADRVAAFNGSWSFIVGLFILTLLWIAINSRLFGSIFDSYPYQFYNLFLAILVSLQGPLIMMSQNREAFRDRATAANDYRVNLKNETHIEIILRELCDFRAESRDALRQVETRLSAVENGPRQ
jgi:CRP/FNR family cyclic AMP-dependent transcriptional regulator